MAQLTYFDWVNPVEKSEVPISKLIAFDDYKVVVFKSSQQKIRLDFIDAEKDVSTKVLTLKGKCLGVYRVGDALTIFSSVYNGRTKKNELYAQLIATDEVKEVLVAEQALVGKLHNNFKVSISPDFKQLFVLVEKPHNKGKKEAIVFNVYNEQFKLLRSQPYLMNTIYSQKRRINVPMINNKGEVFLLKRHRVQNQSKYYVIGYSTGGNVSFKEFKLNYKPILDAQYVLDANGQLIVGGTYTSPNSMRAEGIYIAKFDVNANMVYRKEYGFRHETMLAFTTEKVLKKNGLGLSNFKTNSVLIQKENIALILEHRESKANTKTGVNKELKDGIIICSFDHKGNFIWDVPLKMNQNDWTEKGYWNSFICFNDTANNNLSIVYNEVGYFDKKADNDFGENVAVGARNITIDNQGNYKVGPVKDSFKGAPFDLVFNAKITQQVGDKIYLLAEPLDKTKYLFGVAKTN